ncbi:MAG TPA: hypothetical protein VIV65_11170, partial [Gemmatimonadaceae bacterium]
MIPPSKLTLGGTAAAHRVHDQVGRGAQDLAQPPGQGEGPSIYMCALTPLLAQVAEYGVELPVVEAGRFAEVERVAA